MSQALEKNQDKVNLLGMDLDELETLMECWGQPCFRARQIMLWLYHRRVASFDQMTNISKSFRTELTQRAEIRFPKLVARTQSQVDLSVKYLFELTDGQQIESVLMYDGDRVTVCVSSQVGCAMGCQFCATGQMGMIRNLKAYEILSQLMAIEADLDGPKTATNVVFMGMGEPLANYREVIKALRLMIAPEGLMVAARKITVSTVGLVPRIHAFTAEKMKIGLAISLNATTDEIRTRLMPTNIHYPIREVLQAGKEWAQTMRRRVTIEYVLIRDVNDSLTDARRLRHLLHGIPSKVNLIPYNEIEGVQLRRPSVEQVERFRQQLADGHYVAPVRLSRGNDISAACGQLRTIYNSAGFVLDSSSNIV